MKVLKDSNEVYAVDEHWRDEYTDSVKPIHFIFKLQKSHKQASIGRSGRLSRWSGSHLRSGKWGRGSTPLPRCESFMALGCGLKEGSHIVLTRLANILKKLSVL